MLDDIRHSTVMNSYATAHLLTACDGGKLALRLRLGENNEIEFGRFYGMAVGCILSSILLVLDWGAQVQGGGRFQ